MGIAKGARILCVLFAALSSLPRVRAQQSDAARIYSKSSKSVLLIFVKSAEMGYLLDSGDPKM